MDNDGNDDNEKFLTDKSSMRFKDVIDPFNPQNRISGLLCKMSNRKLGNLWIQEVNGIPCDQKIWTTPHIDYPTTPDGQWIIKGNRVDEIKAYHKLDGTNIVMFMYKDENGKQFISYKTRGMPFIGSDFDYMWREILKKYPDIPQLRYDNGMNISFELYGRVNKHAIIYDVSLDAKVLFGRKHTGEIVPPDRLFCGKVGHAETIKIWEKPKEADLQKDYADMVGWLDTKFEEIPSENGQEFEFSGRGMEGTVWYVTWYTGEVTPFKCKATKVSEVHRKCADGVTPGNINQAIFKTMENGEELNVDNVITTLCMDFPREDVERSFRKIDRMIQAYLIDKEIRTKTYAFYEEQKAIYTTFDINTDKNKVMRVMAKWMNENSIPRWYSASIYVKLMDKYGVKENGA